MSNDNHSPFEMEYKNRASHDTAKRLLKEFNITAGHAAYHYAGNWFGQLDRFTLKYPVVLFDVYGYVIIDSEFEMISRMDVAETIHIPDGLSLIRGYTKYSHEPKGIENYPEQVRRAQQKKKSNPKFNKLKKEIQQIEEEISKNKNIIGFGSDKFIANLEKQLAMKNEIIKKYEY